MDVLRTCKNPQLNARTMQRFDRLWHSLLQLVLQRRGTKQQEVLFDTRCRLLDLFLPVLRRGGCRIVRPHPHQELVLRQYPIRNTKCPQTPIGKHIHILGRLLLQRWVDVGRKSLVNDRVRSLAVQDDPTVRCAHDHAHPFARTVELERLQQRVPFRLSQYLDIDRVLRLAHEREPNVPRGGHERGFVWRFCLVLQIPWFLRLCRFVREDGVADGQRAEESSDVARLFRCPIRNVLRKLGRNECELVNLRVPVLEELGKGGYHGVFQLGQLARKLLGVDSVRSSLSRRRATLRLCDTLSIHNPVDRALLELHDVLRQRTGLVGKDVFDLTEVVRDTPILWDTGGVKGFVVHVDVLCDEIGLDRLDDLDRDEERYGNDVLEGDETGAAASLQIDASVTKEPDSHKGDERVKHGRVCRIHTRLINLHARIRFAIQDAIDDRRECTDDEQEDKVDDDIEVGLLGDLGLLRRRYTSVQVDLGVWACEDDQTDNPGCVAHSATAKEEFVDRYTFSARVAASGVCVAQNSIEEVQILVRWFRFEDERRFLDIFFGGNGRGRSDSLAWFQVGLSVQVLRLQVAQPVRIRG